MHTHDPRALYSENGKFALSVIVCAYRGNQQLADCLSQLEAQTFIATGRAQIIIVDCAAPLAAAARNQAAADAFAGRHPGAVAYIRSNERESPGAARNRAIKLSRATYLFALDPGDRLDDRVLAKLIAVLDERPDVTVAYGDADRESGITRFDPFDRDWLFMHEGIGPHPLWRRSVHQRLGFFDADMLCAGDYEFWLRVSTRHRLVHIPGVLSSPWQSREQLDPAWIDQHAQECDMARERYGSEHPAQGGGGPQDRRTDLAFRRLHMRLAAMPAGRRVALFGAGRHTMRMLERFREAIQPRHHLAAILDDRAVAGGQIAGVPLILAQDWRSVDADVIIVSSDAHEATLAERAKKLVADVRGKAGRTDVPVIGVYRDETVFTEARGRSRGEILAAV